MLGSNIGASSTCAVTSDRPLRRCDIAASVVPDGGNPRAIRLVRGRRADNPLQRQVGVLGRARKRELWCERIAHRYNPRRHFLRQNTRQCCGIR